LCQWLRVISCQYRTSRIPTGTALLLLLLLSMLLVLLTLAVIPSASPLPAAAGERSAVRLLLLLLLVVLLLLPLLLLLLLTLVLLPPLLLRFLLLGLNKPQPLLLLAEVNSSSVSARSSSFCLRQTERSGGWLGITFSTCKLAQRSAARHGTARQSAEQHGAVSTDNPSARSSMPTSTHTVLVNTMQQHQKTIMQTRCQQCRALLLRAPP
jgi:hypothetical protein